MFTPSRLPASETKAAKLPIASDEPLDTSTLAPGEPGSPWQVTNFLSSKPPISDFGFMVGEKPVPCASFEELRSYVAWDKKRQIKFIWVHDIPRLVAPEEVPALAGDVYHREQLHRKSELQTTLFSDIGWLLLGVTYMLRDFATGIFFVFAFTLLPVVQRLWEIRRGRTYSQADAREDAEQNRFAIWLARYKSPLTWILTGAISIIWFAQFASSLSHLGEPGWSPTSSAGLVKQAVWEEGEWWRLFTATVLHGPIWHIIFNMIALAVLGHLVEVLAGWYRLALVFLLSALTGSLFSLVLIPATSVGSSGGIMGLLGFLVVLGYLRPGALPQGFLKSILSGVGMIFLIGLVGFMLIDNAAHLGGLLAGTLLGVVTSRTRQADSAWAVPVPSSPLVKLLGVVASVTLALTIAYTLWILFH